MIAELKEMGIELMVSIWPMVDYKSENFEEMKAKGLLTRVEKGVRIDNTIWATPSSMTRPIRKPEYVWNKAKQNYYDKGVKIFWLDEAEPEYTVYDFENYRYHLGPNVQIGNISGNVCTDLL
ncbi:MAG: TIM-barrel domain-containing protein [Blautia marasmi]